MGKPKASNLTTPIRLVRGMRVIVALTLPGGDGEERITGTAVDMNAVDLDHRALNDAHHPWPKNDAHGRGNRVLVSVGQCKELPPNICKECGQEKPTKP